MKRLGIALAILLALALTVPAFGAEFAFHGDLNNRFTVYTNQSGFFSGAGEQALPDNSSAQALKKDGVIGYWGNIKYRLWTEAATNEGNVKGVYAIEVGGVQYGKDGSGKSQGGSFSGDGVNIETRWAYTDVQLPFIESKSRLSLGLQPTSVNYYLWNETAAGVQWYGAMDDMFDYRLLLT